MDARICDHWIFLLQPQFALIPCVLFRRLISLHTPLETFYNRSLGLFAAYTAYNCVLQPKFGLIYYAGGIVAFYNHSCTLFATQLAWMRSTTAVWSYLLRTRL